jgi:hypothetical protein
MTSRAMFGVRRGAAQSHGGARSSRHPYPVDCGLVPVVRRAERRSLCGGGDPALEGDEGRIARGDQDRATEGAPRQGTPVPQLGSGVCREMRSVNGIIGLCAEVLAVHRYSHSSPSVVRPPLICAQAWFPSTSLNRSSARANRDQRDATLVQTPETSRGNRGGSSVSRDRVRGGIRSLPARRG